MLISNDIAHTDIPTIRDESGPLKVHSVVVEQGRDVSLTCTDTPIVVQDMSVNTSVMWLRIVNGEEVTGRKNNSSVVA